MSLITSAGLWNPDEDDNNTEIKRTTRRVAQKQPDNSGNRDNKDNNVLQDNKEIKEGKEGKINKQQMFGPATYQDTNNNMNTIMNKINSVNIKNAGDNLMKFTPISPPTIQQKKDNDDIQQNNIKKIYETTNLGDSYSNYKTSYASTLSQQIEPFTQNMQQMKQMQQMQKGDVESGGGNTLLEKINYAIHLLEEQQNQKTEHIMEELILYGFVGVFMIFLVDSFNRTSKYTR